MIAKEERGGGGGPGVWDGNAVKLGCGACGTTNYKCNKIH